MSQKKKQEEETIPLLGRFSTQLKMGIVGLPNVGKSSLFNVLTRACVPAENYPFCTKDPFESRVAVPDARFDHLVAAYHPASAVPAFLSIVDIAGLVAGAASGEGLGNAFLSHIRGCDALFHVVRAFDNLEITHVDGEVDPLRDIKIIRDELRFKDIEYVKSRLEHMDRTITRANDRPKFYQVTCFQKVLQMLEDGQWIRSSTDWNLKEVELLNQHLLLTAKPMIYLANISQNDYMKKKNKWLGKISEWISKNDPGCPLIPFSVEFEEALSKMKDPASYCAQNSTQSALNKIIVSGFQILKLEYFFTAGKDEVKAWTIQKYTKAPQAAGKIHTDFEKGFISAEVMKFEDFKEHGSESAVKAAGKYRQEGKTYVVQDGDIIFFKFNVAPKKK